MLVTLASQSIKENQPSDVPGTSLCVFTIRSHVSWNKELNDHRAQRLVQELCDYEMLWSREHLVQGTGGSNLGGSENLQLGNTLPSGIKVSATGEEVSFKEDWRRHDGNALPSPSPSLRLDLALRRFSGQCTKFSCKKKNCLYQAASSIPLYPWCRLASGDATKHPCDEAINR